jgi:AcrR family transcriptional regulator
MSTTTETAPGTKERIIEAAVQAIRTRGSAGASARTIGEIGGFNQALIYYHFGNLNGLLIAALKATSAARLERYRRETESVRDLPGLVAVGRELYAEDVAQGYLTVLSELASACVTHPDLRPEVLASLQPWIELAQGLIERLVEGSALAGMLPTRELAQALVAAYMGMEMLHHLDGDTARTERLFDTLSNFSPMLSLFLGGDHGDS